MAEELGITLRPKKQSPSSTSRLYQIDENNLTKSTQLKEPVQENKQETTPVSTPVKKKQYIIMDKKPEIWEPDGTLILPKDQKKKENDDQNNEENKNDKSPSPKTSSAESKKEFYDRQDKSSQKRLNPEKILIKEAWGNEENNSEESSPKQKYKPDPKSFFARQRKSAEKRNEVQNDFKPAKPQISNGSKAILKKDPKIVKKELEEPNYSFHPDQSLTINYPTNEHVSVMDVENYQKNKDIREKLNAVDIIFDEENQSKYKPPPGDIKLRNKRAKRALERRKQREENYRVPEEKEAFEYRPINPKVPKATREMNSYFKLFKEDPPQE